jgi:GNAT superfamily N-acetyltransferase
VSATFEWRGDVTSTEVNRLYAEAFEVGVHSDEDWDRSAPIGRYSLGWVVARDGEALIGFANVLWDGALHSRLQDVMVAPGARHGGIGTELVAVAGREARAAGCGWLHVDFEQRLRPFYLEACGFRPTEAGLLEL